MAKLWWGLMLGATFTVIALLADAAREHKEFCAERAAPYTQSCVMLMKNRDRE